MAADDGEGEGVTGAFLLQAADSRLKVTIALRIRRPTEPRRHLLRECADAGVVS